MRSGRVLVVDDQIELAENLAEVLQGRGFETDVATSAEAGLERIGQGGVTALITDFELPGRNGAELIEAIRRQGSRIPAMVMSAYTDDRTMDRAQVAGAWLDYVLRKGWPLLTPSEVHPLPAHEVADVARAPSHANP